MGSKELSGKFVIRVGHALHLALKQGAQEKGLSLNQYCIDRLSLEAGPEDHPVVSALRRFLGSSLQGIFLFGSRVRGEQTEGSDIDYLVVIDEKTPLNRDLYRRWDQFIEAQGLDPSHSIHFSYLPDLETSPGSLWLEVASEGFPLYDPKFQVHQRLMHYRKLIRNRVFERSLSHGHPVWRKVIGAKYEEPIPG